MKTQFFLGLMILGMSSQLFAGPREDAVRAARGLGDAAAELSDRVWQKCQCKNTAGLLGEMADTAGDVELEVRYGTRIDAMRKLREVVKIAIDIRKYVAHIPSAQLKREVKMGYLLPLNELGKSIDPNWIQAAPGQDGESNDGFEDFLEDALDQGAVNPIDIGDSDF